MEVLKRENIFYINTDTLEQEIKLNSWLSNYKLNDGYEKSIDFDYIITCDNIVEETLVQELINQLCPLINDIEEPEYEDDGWLFGDEIEDEDEEEEHWEDDEEEDDGDHEEEDFLMGSEKSWDELKAEHKLNKTK